MLLIGWIQTSFLKKKRYFSFGEGCKTDIQKHIGAKYNKWAEENVKVFFKIEQRNDDDSVMIKLM